MTCTKIDHDDEAYLRFSFFNKFSLWNKGKIKSDTKGSSKKFLSCVNLGAESLEYFLTCHMITQQEKYIYVHWRVENKWQYLQIKGGK